MKLSVNIKNKISYNIIIENNLQLFISDYLNIINKGQKWILCYLSIQLLIACYDTLNYL